MAGSQAAVSIVIIVENYRYRNQVPLSTAIPQQPCHSQFRQPPLVFARFYLL